MGCENVNAKRILIVTGDFVYPPNHGDRVDAWNSIKVLKNLGYDIDLICTVKNMPAKQDIDIVNKMVRTTKFIMRRNRIVDMFHIWPLQMYSRRKLKKIKLENTYDYVLLRGTYVIDILENPTLHVKHPIIRMNNDESVYFSMLAKAEPSPLRKLYYFIESYKFKYVDAEIVDRVPNILFVSSDERDRYKARYPHINDAFLPVNIDRKNKERKRNNHNAIMIGSFFMKNNQEGILYYLNQVHPLLSDIPDYHITIAGNSRGQGITWITEVASQYSNVTVLDSPRDLDPLYDEASLFLNTMLHGAGVKLKTVNAIEEGLPVVSTTIGNEGTGLKDGRDIYVEDSPHGIANAIKKLMLNRDEATRLVRNGQKFIKDNYDTEKLFRIYLDNLNDD